MIFKNAVPTELIMLLLHYKAQPVNAVDGSNYVYCESYYEYCVFKIFNVNGSYSNCCTLKV
jgi:hypothetical protein